MLPHGPPCLGAYLRHGEPTAAFDDCQPLGHGFPGLGGTAEFHQVGIAAMDITEVDMSACAQQLQREIRRSMLEGEPAHPSSLPPRSAVPGWFCPDQGD